MENFSDCNCEKKNVLFLLRTRKFFILDFVSTCLLCKVDPMDCEDSEDSMSISDSEEED